MWTNAISDAHFVTFLEEVIEYFLKVPENLQLSEIQCSSINANFSFFVSFKALIIFFSLTLQLGLCLETKVEFPEAKLFNLSPIRKYWIVSFVYLI